METAKEILSFNHLVLCHEDWKLFIETMQNPPEPNEALCKLFKDNE